MKNWNKQASICWILEARMLRIPKQLSFFNKHCHPSVLIYKPSTHFQHQFCVFFLFSILSNMLHRIIRIIFRAWMYLGGWMSRSRSWSNQQRRFPPDSRHISFALSGSGTSVTTTQSSGTLGGSCLWREFVCCEKYSLEVAVDVWAVGSWVNRNWKGWTCDVMRYYWKINIKILLPE